MPTNKQNQLKWHLSLIGGFPGGPVVRNLPASAGDSRDDRLIPGLGRSPGEGNGNPLQYSRLKNPTDTGAWRATARRVAKSRTTEHARTHSLTRCCGPSDNVSRNALCSGCRAWCFLGSLFPEPLSARRWRNLRRTWSWRKWVGGRLFEPFSGAIHTMESYF